MNVRLILKNKWLLVSGFMALALISNSQNLNNPNKRGPLGTQVNTLSGNLFLERPDIYIPARGFDLHINFSYNSFLLDENYGYGNGWTFEYNIRYLTDTTPGARIILWGDGREDKYDSLPDGSYKTPKGFYNTLSEYQPGKYVLTELDGSKYFFDNTIHKRITKMEELNGNFIRFTYTDTLLTALTNAAGQSITFTYNAEGNLATVTDAVTTPSRTFSYSYDAAGNLVEVTDPLSGKFRYTYLVNGPMKTVEDRNGNKIDIIYYPDMSVKEVIGCNKRISFSYNEDEGKTVVTDHFDDGGTNQVTTYTYQKLEDLAWISSMKGNCCGFNMEYEYDEQGNVVKQRDANGNISTYTYDDKGNMLTVTDASGQKSTYTYTDDYNQLATYTDAKGNLYTFSYDARGNLVQITEPGNATYTATYNSNGDIVSSTDPKGNVFTYNYDAYGNPVNVNGPNGYNAALVFDARGNMLSFTDARNNTTTAEYDILGRLKKMTDPLNSIIQYSYDANGNVVNHTNRNNEVSTFNYDASDRVVKAIDPKGNQVHLVYNAMDKVTGIKNALGHEMNLGYDNRNRLSSIRDAEGNVTLKSYDGNGNITSISLPNGNIISYTYDVLNRLTQVKDASGNLADYTYDVNGNILSYTDATGAVTTAAYDNVNRITAITDPLGNSLSYTYDANSNIISVTDQEGNATHLTYDNRNRLHTYTDNNGSVITVGYDNAGNIISLKDQNNNTTIYTYDELNRRKQMTFPDGSYTEFTYDVKGNITARRLTDGSVIGYQYDELNRIVSKTLPGGEIFSYTYDALSRVLTATNNTGTVTFTYDNLNRVMSESFGGRTIQYSYNISGRTQSTVYPDGSTIIKEFDTRSRLVKIAKDGNTLSEYSYNNADQLTGETLGNGITANLQYDFASRLSSINTGEIQSMSYTYDKLNNKTSVVRANNPALSERFTYDDEYRLTEYKRGDISSTPDIQHTYTYDALGNRIAANIDGNAVAYTQNNLNQLTGVNGNMLTYDSRGNLAYDGTFYKTYDAENRLVKDSASPTNIIAYVYDAFGRRVMKNINGSVLKYTYSGPTQVEELDGSDNVVNKTIFAGYLSPVLNEKDGNTYYYHRNELGSIEAITNDQGRVVEKYSYDPYGNTSIRDSSDNALVASQVGNRFGFTGQEWDNLTNSYHFFYRNYNPETGVFNQRDLIEYKDGMGMYQYVGNNPANGIDVWGLKKLDNDPCYRDGKKIKYITEWEVERVLEQMKEYQASTFPNDDFFSVLNHLSSADSRFYTDVKFEKQFGSRDLYFRGEALLNYEANYYFTGYMSGMRGVDPISANVGARAYLGLKGAAGPLVGKSFDLPAIAEAIPQPFFGNDNRTSNFSKGAYDGILDKHGFPEQYESMVDKKYDNKVTEFGEWWPVINPETKEMGYEFFSNKEIPDDRWEAYMKFIKENCNEKGTKKKRRRVWDPNKKMWVLVPIDPNEIIGPQGKPDKKWVSVKETMPYTILCENDKSATAPARYIYISTPIEPKQDAGTLQIGGFGFNNQEFTVPSGQASYYTRLDCRDSMNLYVDVVAGYNQLKNEIFWEFRGIDPVTLMPTDDPEKGILFLQDSTRPNYGHGFVTFSLKPKEDAVTLDTIGARAKIVFDGNDTIPTNIYTNTIDAYPPASQLNSITGSAANAITLNWTGADDPGGSGIDYYTVYVSTDGVNYSILFQQVYGTDTTFSLPTGSDYCFFVLATDLVGHTEEFDINKVQCKTIGGPLPVTFLYFNGTNQGKDNLLQWGTANEENSKEFRLERSLNGINYNEIAIVPSTGNNSGASQSYSYTDKDIDKLNSTVMFYRLKQVDIDENFRYSPIVRLNYYGGSSTKPTIVYPNPTQGWINIVIGDNTLIGTEAVLTDINGRVIQRIKITSANQTINLVNLVNGMYLIQLGNKETLKVLKQ